MDYAEEASRLAILAVKCDTENKKQEAAMLYLRAALLLDRLAISYPTEQAEKLRETIKDYRNRATKLSDNADEKQSEDHRLVSKCYFTFEQALDADEAGLEEKALELYMNAVEIGINMKVVNEDVQAKVTKVAREALERAEKLKGISYEKKDLTNSMAKLTTNTNSIGRVSSSISVKNTPGRPELIRGNSIQLKLTSGNEAYSEEEKMVLLHTSNINKNQFVPFMNIDLTERFQYSIPFTDKDGLLTLAKKQQKDFHKWVRPDEICSDPKMIVGQHIDCFSIKQTVVSDCSFVASLAVSALYEKRFGKKLITKIIYPRNKNKDPVINPFGKYMVKLHLNGVPRKVIIDEFLPASKYGQLLCSYSNNKNEFWVSLLEKAYMKVMGGYDFPGSNSNIDLHALTGWIPERCPIRRGEPDFNADLLFKQLRTRLERGDVLATVATGELPETEADRTGLVPTHAYAVLDVRIENDVKLLKLKNPWSHLRWRGRYSELDITHWTSELRTKLNYDPDSAAQYDNGVFWIDYESILNFFDVFYLNWNPEMFTHTYCIHQCWNAGTGPMKDAYNIGDNHQFNLQVKGQGAIWVLLTRHITEIDDFRENKEYITVLVYKNEGRRVYYPHDPEPYIDGVRINSPHYLCKIIVGENSARKYTLVVSQYEKMRTIYYTLRAYGTCTFDLKKIEPFPFHKQLSGEWIGQTAGGCANHPLTHRQNPSFMLVTKLDGSLVLDLKGPKQYQMGMDVTVESLDDSSVTAPFRTKSSAPYRSGFVILELDNIPAGKYRIMVSTFYPQQEGPFILSVKSTCDFRLITV